MKKKIQPSRNQFYTADLTDIYSTEEGIKINKPRCNKQCNIMATLKNSKTKPYKTTEKKHVYTIRKIASKEYNRTIEWIDHSACNSQVGVTPLHPIDNEFNLLTIKNDTAHKQDTEQRAGDPYFKFTSDVKKDISPRVPEQIAANAKIKCQVNLNKFFGGDSSIPKEVCNKENLLVNDISCSNGFRLPGKFIQPSRGVPIIIKPHQKGPPKIPKH